MTAVETVAAATVDDLVRGVGRGAYPLMNHLPGGCPTVTENEATAVVDPSFAARKDEPSPMVLARMEEGNEHESEVGATLVEAWTGRGLRVLDQHELGADEVVERLSHPDAGPTLVVVDEDDPRASDVTVAALRAGAAKIWAAVLPERPRQRIKPDLLSLVDEDDPGRGYVPVEVKLSTLPSGATKPAEFLVDRVADRGPAHATAAKLPGKIPPRYALQLALYHRALRQLGGELGETLAGDPVAGVIGAPDDTGELRVVYQRLDEARYTVRESGAQRRLTPFDLLDEAAEGFTRTLEAFAADGDDPRREPLHPPEYQASLCGECPWFRQVCEPQLAARGALTYLVAGVTPARAHAHYTRGNHTVEDVASLCHRTAALVDAGLDVPSMITQARTGTLGASAPAIETLPRARRSDKRQAALDAAGVRTAGDVAALDSRTAAYAEGPSVRLAATIDQARVVLAEDGTRKVFKARGVDALDVGAGTTLDPGTGREVPVRPAVEFHVDLEHDRRRHDLTLIGCEVRVNGLKGRRFAGYHAFDALDVERRRPDLDPVAVSGTVVAEFWAWIHALFDWFELAKVGPARVYHYDVAERVELAFYGDAGARAGVPGCPTAAEVTAAMDGPRWVDLKQTLSSQTLFPTRDFGLKRTGGHAGHEWSTENASGDNAVVLARTARDAADPHDRAAAQSELRGYNRDDCLATATLLDFVVELETAHPEGIPSVESLGGAV